ncbi:MAG: Ig-like domain-containing protein [Planctomycetota bacterium]
MSNLGHTIQYQFDWKGDGTVRSAWGSASQSKTWSSGNTYNIRARARCSTHPSVISGWSSGLSVIISDTTPPTVLLVNPSNNSTDVSVSTNITVTFSEPMSQTTAQGAFSISPSVSGAFSWSTNSMTFDPTGNLAYSTPYTCTVSTAAKDLAGNSIAIQYQWSFTTAAPDTTPPTVLSVSPSNNSIDVSVSTNISVTFSEAMNQSTAQGAFSISPSVSGAFSWTGNIMTFDPTGNLTYSTLYTCTISNAATDLAGNNIASQYQWSFTTSALSPPPTCTTNAATNITATSATLNGTVNPNGFNVTSCYFDYASGTTPPTYGLTATVSPLPGSGTTGVAVSANISSLSTNTLYNFRVVATNAGGTTNGSNLTFIPTAVPTAVDDYCWVANYGSDTVTRITKSTLATTTIAVGGFPAGVAVDETYVWVANIATGANNVTRIRKSDLSTTTIVVGGPYKIAVDGTYCWVSTGGAYIVTRITKATNATTRIEKRSYLTEVAVDGTYCWVTNYYSDNVTRIQKSNPAISTTIAVGSTPRGVAVDETYCWVVNEGSGTVTRIRKSDSTTTTIAVYSGPQGIAVDGTYCWVTNWDSNNVTRIRKSDSTTTTIAVGDAPTGVAVDGTYCWVANWGSNTVTRITKATNATTTIAVGDTPISQGDMTGYAYDNYSRVP